MCALRSKCGRRLGSSRPKEPSLAIERYTTMRRLLLLVAGLLAVLAIACGDDSSSPDPTASPGPSATPENISLEPTDVLSGERPPALTILGGDETADAALGTFCWERLCVDAIGPLTPPDAIDVDGEEIGARVGDEPVEEAAVTAQLVGGADQPVSQELEGGLLAWTGGAPGVALPVEVVGSVLSIDLRPLEGGCYILSFFVRFQRGGDASYGIVLEKGLLNGCLS